MSNTVEINGGLAGCGCLIVLVLAFTGTLMPLIQAIINYLNRAGGQ